MGDELLLRSRCPGGTDCVNDGAEHVYLRERTVTPQPPRAGLRSSRVRRTSNRGHGVETLTISKTNTHSTTISSTSTESVEVTSMVTRRSRRAGSARPAAPAPAPAPAPPAERLRSDGSTSGSERRLSNEYLAYSSDDEFEEFISQPKTDYTYARSMSYNAISPQHVTPPNMSRRCLHSLGGAAELATGAGRPDDRLELSLSRDMRDYSYSREAASRLTSSTTAANRDVLAAAGAAAVLSSGVPAAVLPSPSAGADGDSCPTAVLPSPPTGPRSTDDGSLYYISGGLDVDSADEDYMENNNVSKSASYESYKFTQETKTNRWVVTTVLLTLLYPATYLWSSAKSSGRRLLWQERAADTAAAAAAAAPATAAPAPGSVEYRRLMRGLPRLGGDGRSQRQWPRTAGPPPRTTVTTVTSCVTSVLTTVVTLLCWPARRAAAAVRALSSHSETGSGVTRRGAAPLGWLRAAGLAVLSSGQWAAATAARTVTGAAAWTAETVTGATAWTAETVTGATAWTAGALGGAAKGTVGAVGGVAKGTVGALGGAAKGTAGAVGGVAKGTASILGGAAKGTAGTLGGAASGTAGVLGGAARGTAGVLGGAASGTAGVLGGAARGTAGALSGVARGTAGAVSGAARGLVSRLGAAAGRTWDVLRPGAAAGSRAALAAGKAERRRRLCLCLLPLLLLLLLLLLPLLWGLYCEEDQAATVTSQESAVLHQLKAAPVAAWVVLRDTAAFIGTSTVHTASSVYGYLSLLGGSALLTSPPAEPASPAPEPVMPVEPAIPVAPAVPVAPVVPVAPAVPVVPPSEDALAAVNARLEELQDRLTALQADFQSCQAASESARQPAAVRAALGLGAGQLLTADQLAAAEQRQAEQLSGQLRQLQLQLEAGGSEQRAGLEARLEQLELTAARLQLPPELPSAAEQRAEQLAAELIRLQEEYSGLHRTLLVVQESLKQVRSCCNRTDPDWSALLSKRLQSLESDLEGRLQVFASTIKEELASESAVTVAAAAAGGSGGGVSREDVELIARQALAQYDADKTGRFDYALESAGGSVLSTKCTEAYNVKSARISVLGIPLWYPSNNPRTIIQPSVSPGECFAFRGQGYFVLALSRRIEPTEFVMEHIPPSLTPTAAIDSAPRNFTVLGLSDGSDQEGTLLGHYVYRESGPPLQAFPVQRSAGAAFSVVELRVHDNWGHRDYTCLYRFRVHGRPDPAGAGRADSGSEEREHR